MEEIHITTLSLTSLYRMNFYFIFVLFVYFICFEIAILFLICICFIVFVSVQFVVCSSNFLDLILSVFLSIDSI